jgi:hypothetical protein
MNDLTPIPSHQQSAGYSLRTDITVELAKALALVAPITMTSEQQEVWLRAAIDAMQDIRSDEIAAVSMELRRTATRPAQIVPEISRLVDERRKRARKTAEYGSPSPEWRIDLEAQERRGRAHNQEEVEAAWQWERNARIEAGLHVAPLEKPLNRQELDNMPGHVAALGLKYGFLKRENGHLVEKSQA